MRKISLFTVILTFIVFSACEGPKDPTFEGIDNLMVKSMTAGNITVSGDMTLYNPNPFSCHLKNLYLEIFTDNDTKLTEITQTYNTEMIANSDFKMPVLIGFSPLKLSEDKGGLIGSVVTALADKEILMKYKGYCTIEVMEIQIEVPVEYEEKMTLKIGKDK